MKILLAEDNRDMNHAIVTVLKMQSWDVDSVFDGKEAVEMARLNGYDCMILDIMMPIMTGLEALREIRMMQVMTPVIMLTAKAEVDDRVEGLEAGADDYLTKPFAMKELLARVKAQTRRSQVYQGDAAPDSVEKTMGNLVINRETLEMRAVSSVRLSAREFDLMQVLMDYTEEEVSFETLLKKVWPDENEASSDMLWLYVNYLRRKLQSVHANVTILDVERTRYRIKLEA